MNKNTDTKQPPIEIACLDDGAMVDINMPGVDKQDIEIELEDGTLVVEGETEGSLPDYHLEMEIGGESREPESAYCHLENERATVIMQNKDHKPGGEFEIDSSS